MPNTQLILSYNSWGDKSWWLNGKLHREDGPAVENIDGSKEWWINGKRHREDGPAIEYANGNKYWYINGKRHREDGPAIEWVDGDKEWYLNGKRHREDGPAVEYADGAKEWYINDERHREDGPAVEHADGHKEWYFNGHWMLSLTQFKKIIKLKQKKYKFSFKYLYKYDYKTKILHRYYFNGKEEFLNKNGYHREDGPALIEKNSPLPIVKEWWVNGKRHRINGAAVIQGKYKAYYYHGIFYNKKEYFKKINLLFNNSSL